MPENTRQQAKLAVKDEYTFDFLELAEEHSERELERALLSRIEHFLREMGGLFAFVGSQYRLEIGNHEYFIDLLLFHRPVQHNYGDNIRAQSVRIPTGARRENTILSRRPG